MWRSSGQYFTLIHLGDPQALAGAIYHYVYSMFWSTVNTCDVLYVIIYHMDKEMKRMANRKK